MSSLASYFTSYLNQNGVGYDLSALSSSVTTNTSSIATANQSLTTNTTNIGANSTFSTNLASSFGTTNATGTITSLAQSFADLVLTTTASDRFATSSYATNLAASVGTYNADGTLSALSEAFANSVMTATTDATFATSTFVNNLGSSFGTVASNGTITLSEAFANSVLSTTTQANFASTTYVNNMAASFGTIASDGTLSLNSAFADAVMALETGPATATASSVTTLGTTVGQNTTSVNTNTASINGVTGKYGVTIDSNGGLTGFELLGGGGASDFIVTANKFKIYSSNGALNPFTVITDGSSSKVQINGSLNVSDTVVIQGTGDFTAGDGSINDVNGRPTALLMKAGAVANDAGSVCLEMQSAQRWHHVIKTTGGTDGSGNFDLNAEYRLGKSLVAGDEGDNFSKIMMKLNGAGLIIPNQSANSVTPSADYASGMNIIFNENSGSRTADSGRLHVSEYYKTFFLDIPSSTPTTGTYANKSFVIRKYVAANPSSTPPTPAYDTSVVWFDNSNDSLHIDGACNATAFNTTSDYRLKEDYQSFNGLDIIDDINVYDFKWKDKVNKIGKRAYGVKAHELDAVVTSAVTGEKDATGMQTVDYSKLVPILIKSIQELKAEIEILKG
tara:strand:+ start:856 stop:2715 length:1860 start_codon:yes stop_codon:yes gene_type:complete